MDTKKTKQQLLKELYQPYQNPAECPVDLLGGTQVVFGEGNPDATLMFIGEAPGAQEDKEGRPFIGRSGKLLTRTLEKLGIQRKDVFITNIVKCRPPNNRTPSQSESKLFKELFLLKEIEIIKPKVICTLGSASLCSLLDQTVQITQVRGKPQNWQNIILLPAYHPAYILRKPKELTTFTNDLSAAIDKSK